MNKKHKLLISKHKIIDNELLTTSSTKLFIRNKHDVKIKNSDPVSNMFTTVLKSMHGRQVKPTPKLFESLEESYTSNEILLGKGFIVFNL